MKTRILKETTRGGISRYRAQVRVTYFPFFWWEDIKPIERSFGTLYYTNGTKHSYRTEREARTARDEYLKVMKNYEKIERDRKIIKRKVIG